MIPKTKLDTIADERIRLSATYASVAVAIVLIITKLAAYLLTDSVAVLSSLLDSTLDLIAGLVTVLGVASALQPPDADHRYGHGKAEPLAALAQSAFIVGSSVLLAYEALNRLIHPQKVDHEMIGYVVMLVSSFFAIGLTEYQRYVVRRTNSIAIHADRIHYIGDVVINLAVIAALGLYQLTGKSWFDPAFTLIIAASMTYNAYGIAVNAFHVLMDRELPEEKREQIKSIVCVHPQVVDIHDMRTRSDSDRIFVEMHVEMDPKTTLSEAHKVDERIKASILQAFPNADILLHHDPAGIKEQRLDEQIANREAEKALEAKVSN